MEKTVDRLFVFIAVAMVVISSSALCQEADSALQCRSLFASAVSKSMSASQYTSHQRKILKDNLEQLGHHYLSAKAEGQFTIRFLQSLGFRFSPGGIEVPDPGGVFTKLDSLIESIKRRHHLSEDQIYRGDVRSVVEI